MLDKLKDALKERFAVERELGRGGTATVYLAREFKHDRLVAVKVLHPELTTSVGAERFLQEIEITARLQHPNILPLLDSGAADGLLYYVMPYVEGQSLFERLKATERLPVAEALRIGSEVAGALGHAHERWVAHLDVKPGNVLLSNGHAMIADFGIARAICRSCRDSVAVSDMIIGTPEYMSPEQSAGIDNLDGRSDIYSLACVLFEMLTGSPPFAGQNPAAIVHQHLGADPPSARALRSEIPEAVDRMLVSALAKDPETRLATAGEFAEVLRGETALQLANPETPNTPGRSKALIGRFVTAGAGALSLLLGALAMLAFGRPAEPVNAEEAADERHAMPIAATDVPAAKAPELIAQPGRPSSKS
jgi:serine/threonine-protein kinase